MNKIKFFGILTFLLLGIAVPQNDMLEVNAASGDTELLSYVYDLFGNENIVEYYDIDYISTLPEGDNINYEVTCPIVPNLGSEISDGVYSREYFYSYKDGVPNENLIDDILFNNFWSFSLDRLTLEDTFVMDKAYASHLSDNISDFEGIYRSFDFYNDIQNSPDFYFEENTSGTSLSKEELLSNPGIKYEGKDEDGNYIYKKKSWASLGGVSLLQQSMYLNTSFDESLKGRNNLEICLSDINESGYWFDDFINYNYTLASFFDVGTFYNYPLIEVNGKPFVYVVLEGNGGHRGEHNISIVCIDSKFRMEQVLDNFGFYMSIPYHSYIETISYTLPYYTSSYCWDVDKQYSTEHLNSDYDYNILKGVPGFMSFAPFFWNDETLDRVKDHVDYHPVSVHDIDADNKEVTFKYFTSEAIVENDAYTGIFVEDFVLRDVGDYCYYTVKINDVSSLDDYDGGAYVYCTYTIVSGLPKPGQSRTYEVTSVEFDGEYPLYGEAVYRDAKTINPNIYNSEKNKYGNRIKYKKNLTKERVYLDAFIDRQGWFRTFSACHNSITFSFYHDFNREKKIESIDHIYISFSYKSGENFSCIIDSNSEFDFFGQYYRFTALKNHSKYVDAEYFSSMSMSHLFPTVGENGSGHGLSIKTIVYRLAEDGDFVLYHYLKTFHYRKGSYDSVNAAYCNYWIGEDTYIKGGFGDSVLSIEYDENGTFIGVTDKNGDVVPDYSIDDDGNIVDDKGEIVKDDSANINYSSNYYGKHLDNLFDTFKDGLSATFSLDGTFGKILSVVGILVVIVLISKLVPVVKKNFKEKNKKKRI